MPTSESSALGDTADVPFLCRTSGTLFELQVWQHCFLQLKTLTHELIGKRFVFTMFLLGDLIAGRCRRANLVRSIVALYLEVMLKDSGGTLVTNMEISPNHMFSTKLFICIAWHGCAGADGSAWLESYAFICQVSDRPRETSFVQDHTSTMESCCEEVTEAANQIAFLNGDLLLVRCLRSAGCTHL